ncbi:MAG: phage terminase small subunit P27 family, partial [Desulfocapsa sp.]
RFFACGLFGEVFSAIVIMWWSLFEVIIMGRRPETDEQQLLKGNPSKRAKRGKKKTIIPVLNIEPPKELRDFPKACAIWSELAPMLEMANFVKQTDRGALGRYCYYMSLWFDLIQVVKSEGATYWTESKHGSIKRKSPDFSAMLDLESKIAGLEDRIGLTPSMRQRVELAVGSNGEGRDQLLGLASGASNTDNGLFAPYPKPEHLN